MHTIRVTIVDDALKEMADAARSFVESNNQALLAFAKSNNPEAAIMPQIMVSDFSSRNYLKADVYLRSSYARGYVILKRHKSGEGYRWLISDGYSCFIDLGLVAANLAEAKKVFSGLFQRNQEAEIYGYSRWYRDLV